MCVLWKCSEWEDSTFHLVWIFLFATTLVISAAACLIYQVLSTPEKRGIPETYSKYLWAFQTGLVGQGFGENKRWFLKHVWSLPSFRLLQSLWFIAVCVIFLYTYQGGVISAFAADKLKPRISNLEELMEDKTMGISTLINSYPMNLFKRMENTSYGSLWSRMKNHLVNLDTKETIPAWLDTVESGKTVFIAERFWLRYLISDRFVKTGRCALRATDLEMGSTYIGFAFRKELRNETVFKNFNKVIRRFVESNIQHYRVLTYDLYYEICTGESVAVKEPLKLSDLVGAFIIFALGNTLACIFFILEFLKQLRSKA